jgi:hypothetical protein
MNACAISDENFLRTLQLTYTGEANIHKTVACVLLKHLSQHRHPQQSHNHTSSPYVLLRRAVIEQVADNLLIQRAY